MDSKFLNRRRARQLIDFANIRIGEKGMPTDCDGLIEYHNKAIAAGKTFEELKAARRSPQTHSHCRHTYGF